MIVKSHKKYFATWFDSWIKDNPSLTNKRIGDALEVTPQLISEYRHGNTCPPRRRLHQIGSKFPWDIGQAEWRCGEVPQEWIDLPAQDYLELFQIIRMLLICKQRGARPEGLLRYLNGFVNMPLLEEKPK